jgi:hypothetical protein
LLTMTYSDGRNTRLRETPDDARVRGMMKLRKLKRVVLQKIHPSRFQRRREISRDLTHSRPRNRLCSCVSPRASRRASPAATVSQSVRSQAPHPRPLRRRWIWSASPPSSPPTSAATWSSWSAQAAVPRRESPTSARRGPAYTTTSRRMGCRTQRQSLISMCARPRILQLTVVDASVVERLTRPCP